ncbi:MAG: radical SAM protein [Nitrosopumilus sp.]
MNVLFVNPPFVDKVNGVMRYGCRAGSRWPWSSAHNLSDYAPFPFFMAYAASFLEKYGVQVGMYDSVAIREINYDSFYRNVREMHPEIIVIETSSPTIHIDLQVAKKLSEILPKSEIALSGPHSSVFAEELIKLPYIRYVLKGEYEINSLEMWKTRRSGIYECTLIKDIDSSPYPYRDPKVIAKYWDQAARTPRPQLAVCASRGCPFKCTFCMWMAVMYRGMHRLRDPKKVVEEVRYCVSEFGARSILFDDDSFNIGTDRISTLCDELKTIGIPWTMMGRLDTSPLWLFDKMIDCGCASMKFGVETFSSKLQKNIKKGLAPKTSKKVLMHFSKKHPRYPVKISMIRNLPGETEEDRQLDVRILKEIGFDNTASLRYQVVNCIPFPGTELYNKLVVLGHEKLLRDFSMYDGSPDRDNVLAKIVTEIMV